MSFLYKKNDFLKTRETDEIDIFSANFQNDAFSLVKAEIKGQHDCFSKRESDRTYFIIQGEATFYAEGDEFTAVEGDVVTFPKDVGYSVTGKNTQVITINNPPFKK